MDWPGSFETADEMDIETRSGEVTRRTTIWPVVDGDKVYIRPLRGAAGRWYRELMAEPDTVVHVRGEAVPVRAVPAGDAESIERATAGYRRKYEGSPYLATMIRDEILPTTLRLERR